MLVDRKKIRKSRKSEAKKAKRAVTQKYEEVLNNRPPKSYPADQVLKAAVKLYKNGPILQRELKAAVATLEASIRQDLPDLVLLRSPRTVSAKPGSVGLMVFETRAVTEQEDRIVSAENHSVVLEEERIVFISGLLPGGARPHLFERVHERARKKQNMAEVLLRLSDIWPTLLWMRAEQRLQGRGVPINVMITPFVDGLMFGSLEKVEGLPPAGPTVAIVSKFGQETRNLHDFFGDNKGSRLWAMTKTFVDGALLAPDQLELRDMLRGFVSTYADIVADNNWRWRIGLGIADEAVEIVAKTFKLAIPNEERRSAALIALEAIIDSETWQTVAAQTRASQRRTSPL